MIGGIVGGVIGIFKGPTALNQNVKCPHCKARLAVNRAEGPNYNCAPIAGASSMSSEAGTFDEPPAGFRTLR